jgi:phenylalanyl-tRNA synthetase beta chain
MRVSLNTIKQFTEVDVSVDELVAKINAQLGGVEEVIDLGKKYQGATVAKIVHCKKHENADKLSVCEIDAGTGENVQVVCGAPNVREGMFVVWLKPGVTVPSTFDDKEPFVLEARELRGVVSNGMLASARELGLGDDHDGILEIDPNEWKPNEVEIRPGVTFADAFGLDDVIIDIENKMFTHRPDLFGQLGIAREISGILGREFKEKDWYWNRVEFTKASGLELEVFNDTHEKVPRFAAVAMKNIEVKASPLWLRCALVAMGSKSINNIVDVTNYVMLLTAQPTHAYDYDKLRGRTLGVRMAIQGETVTLLNSKTYKLDETDIVIVDGEGPVGLGGVMGGGNSEVSVETKNIVLEVATFDMYAVRKSSMRHGLFTDALTRFNKGQSPLQNDRVLNLLMMSIKDVSASAEQASSVSDRIDSSLAEAQDAQSLSGTLKVEPSFINDRLGLTLSSEEIQKLLHDVSFSCYVDKDAGDTAISFTAPFWRTDIELPEDIVEEVGRLYGFGALPQELPSRSVKPPTENTNNVAKEAIRRSLANAGANEALTYSFVHEKVLKNAEQDVAQAFQLSNALSPDLQYYRLSVLPSLLDKVHANIKSGHDEFTLFEIGKGHNKKYHLDDDNGLPSELEFVDAVYACKRKKDGAPYFRIKQIVDQLCSDAGFELVYKSISEEMDYPVTSPFEQSRSALLETHDGIFIGMIGEIKQSVRKKFKLPGYVSAMTLDFEGLKKAMNTSRQTYQSLSKYPSLSQDVSLKVGVDISYDALFNTMRTSLAKNLDENFSVKLSPVSIYQSTDDIDTKTITLHLEVTSYTRTLTDSEIATALDGAVETAHAEHAAARI